MNKGEKTRAVAANGWFEGRLFKSIVSSMRTAQATVVVHFFTTELFLRSHSFYIGDFPESLH